MNNDENFYNVFVGKNGRPMRHTCQNNASNPIQPMRVSSKYQHSRGKEKKKKGKKTQRKIAFFIQQEMEQKGWLLLSNEVLTGHISW